MTCFLRPCSVKCSKHHALPWRRGVAQLVLRPYQQACLDACHTALRAGVTRIGVSLPTGAGKTTVFTTLLSQIPSPRPSQAFSSLIIVNSVELARQAAAQAERTHPHWKVELEQGSKHRASGQADVTVATYQTLLQPQRLAKFRPEILKAIIVDEAHHAAAPSYRRILSHFNADIKNPDPHHVPPFIPHTVPVIGFSATFSRHDGLALGSVFEKIVYHRDFLDMINEKWLCDVRFTSVKASIDLQDVTINSRTGDFNTTGLAHIINTETINNLVVQAWLDRASSDRKSTLVFCVNLAHVRQLTSVFREYGIDARHLHASTPANERRTLITEFKTGCYPVLVNCAILTEGADIPNVDCIVICRPTRSRNVYAQMIGRGMRQSPASGKVDCRIIDFVDSTSRICGVVSIPTLLGLDPSEIVDDVSIADLGAKAASIGSSSPDDIPVNPDYIPEPTSVTYFDYDDPFAMVDSFSGAPHISRLSPNAWVGCGSNVYVLECLGKGHIRVEPDPEGEAPFRATYTAATMHFSSARQLNVSPFMRKRLISTSNTLSDALKGCDTYARQRVLHGPLVLGYGSMRSPTHSLTSSSLLRSARWRQAPATESQKTFINRRRGKRAIDRTSVAEATEKLTKGEAANIITRLKHGAQAYYEKQVKDSRKQSQLAERERLRVKRSTVRVGLLE